MLTFQLLSLIFNNKEKISNVKLRKREKKVDILMIRLSNIIY